MNRKFFALITILGLVPFSTFAGVKVASVDLKTSGPNGYLNIVIDGRAGELPDVKVNGNTIEITLNKADPFTAISKNVRGAQLSANVLNGNAIVKAIMPYDVPVDSLELGWKNNGLEIIFPRGVKKPAVVETKAMTAEIKPAVSPSTTTAPAATTAAKVTEEKAQIVKEVLNEDYLNKLMKETTAKAEVPEEKKDEINVKQAAPLNAATNTEKTDTQVKAKANGGESNSGSDGFSFAGYAVKFTVFLAMVLGLFYGVVQVLKKGVFNRGKLGFLNNSQLIEVLSTTYVGPKKTLMVVRAHKQIFLVGNSESGLVFLSEMTDTSGLIKEGERQITGTNFDLKLGDAETNGNLAVKLKENIMESSPMEEQQSGLAKLANAKDDIVKFSDELKKKAKKLKPIEFN